MIDVRQFGFASLLDRYAETSTKSSFSEVEVVIAISKNFSAFVALESVVY